MTGDASVTARTTGHDREQAARPAAAAGARPVGHVSGRIAAAISARHGGSQQIQAGPLAGMPATDPYWAGRIRLIDHYVRGTRGMGARFDLTDALGDQPSPFRGLKDGASSGQRLTMLISSLDPVDPVPIYRGEGILAHWHEDARGVHLELKFDDGPDGSVPREAGAAINPFQNHRADRETGEEFVLAFWLVEDNEVLTGRFRNGRKRPGFNAMGAAQQSQILCKTDPDFQEWAIRFAGGELGIEPIPGEPASETAARIVRAWCGVESRAEFAMADGAIARERWADLLHLFRTRPRD